MELTKGWQRAVDYELKRGETETRDRDDRKSSEGMLLCNLGIQPPLPLFLEQLPMSEIFECYKYINTC